MVSSILFVSMVIGLAVEVNSLSEVTEILYYLVTQTAYLIKLVNFMITRYKLPIMEEHVQNKIIYKYYHMYGSECLDSISRICTFTAHFFRVCVTTDIVFYVMVPLMDTGHILPFAGWYPLDKEKYRGLLFLIQMISFVISAYTNISIDIFTAHYISVAVGELRLLKICLMNIDYTLENNEKRSESARSDDLVGACLDEDEEELPKLPPSSLDDLVFIHKHAIV